MKTSEVREANSTNDHLRILYPAPINEESLYSVLTKWSVVINKYGASINSNEDDDKKLPPMLQLSGILKQQSKEFFIQSIVGKIAVQDKRELTIITQSIITRFLDQLFKIQQHQTDSKKTAAIKLIIEQVIEVFEFIKEYFSNYFDYTQKVPLYLLIQLIASLNTSAESLKKIGRQKWN